MKTAKFTTIGAMLFLLGASAIFGCTSHRRAVVVDSPNCSQALTYGVSGYSDNEIAEILDLAENESNPEQCWAPLIQICLDQRREIPQEHLKKAVHFFNQSQFEDSFHKSVHRYLGEIAKGREKFTPKDRRLLESYCSYVINHAQTSSDENLSRAKLLSRRLDPELYAKFFN